jgi:pimeloyl-ACP methyl ester carboxylesterase
LTIPRHRIATLIFAGEMDEMTPPPVMEALARHLPHARLVKVAGAGHSVYLRSPPSSIEAYLHPHPL